MKRRAILTTTIALLLTGLATTARAGTSTAIATGSWSNASIWSSSPSGFAPNNGNNGENWSAVVNSGTITTDIAITIETLTFGGGTITGTNTLTMNQLSSFTAGTMGGSGTTQANGGVTFSGTSAKIIGSGRTLNLGADSTWSAGNIRLGISSVLATGTGATLDNSFDGIMENLSGGTAAFNNAGTFTKSAGTGVTSIGDSVAAVSLNNTGTVNVNSGTLLLGGGGTSTGTWNVANGTTLDFEGGTHALNAGTALSALGTGIVRFSGGATSFNAGSYSVAGTTQINGGTANFNAAASTNLLNLSSGVLGGTGTLTVNGLTTFTGGTMTGAGITQADGGVIFSGTAAKAISSNRVVNLGANSTWSAGNIRLGTSTVLATGTGATFDNSFDGTIENTQGGIGNFNNAGTFTKSAGAGTTTIQAGVAFNNTGIVNVNSGTLQFNQAGTHTGAFNVAAGATMNFDGGTHAMNAGTSFAGAGTTSITGSATVNINAPVSVGTSLLLSSGIIGGTGTLTVNGLTTFTGGTMTGAGITQAVGGVIFSGTSAKAISTSRVLNLGANSTWSAGNIRLGTSTVLATETGVTLDNSFDGTIENTQGGVGTFNNAGTFTKSAGAGTTTISSGGGVTFNNTGTVNANSGTLAINGTLTQHSGTTLTGGTWNVSNGAAISRTTGSDIQTIGAAATVKLDGAGSSFNKVTTALNNNQGTFHLTNNRDYTTPGNFANSGTLRVEDAVTLLTVNGILTQSAGNTNLVNGGSITANAFNLNGGFLSGTGNVTLALNGDLIAANGSKLSPGNSAGTLAINLSGTGDLDISGMVSGINSDSLVFEIGAAGSSDLITLSGGPLKIGTGLLEFDDFDFSTLGGFVANSVHTLFNGNTAIIGTLGANLTGTVGGLDAFISFGDGGNDLILTVVPEPGTAAVGIALLGVAMGRRRRRQG